jgi:hypothetical protein
MNPLFDILEKEVPAHQFRGTFGVSQEQFKLILKTFSVLWQEEKDQKSKAVWDAKGRAKKKNSGGGKSKLPTADKALAFVLYYLKQYPTFSALASQFGMTSGNANILLHYHRVTLLDSLKKMNVVPKTSFATVDEFEEFLKNNKIEEILGDATERPIQRPKDKERQKTHYSGKKKVTV